MVEDNSSRSRKQSRSIRPRSPNPLTLVATEHSSDGRPPTKRARKAINCEPCRASKLKCDRSRPCSSCVLRGTSALCYQDSQSQDGSEHQVRGDDNHLQVDVAQEIARLRNSVNILEAYIQRGNVAISVGDSSTPLNQQRTDREGSQKNSPAMLALYGGGLYAGPTSAATHLMGDVRDSDDPQMSAEKDPLDDITHEYDRDLINLLPPPDTIDQLIEVYFTYSNWVFRYVNQPAFTKAWARFKAGECPDRIVLATVCMIMAVAVQYLPRQHPLLEILAGDTVDELGLRFHDVMLSALQRHSLEPQNYTLEYMELLLIRCQFHSLCRADSEEIWSVRGSAISVALAMGLHRDPGRWKMSREVTERRRWTWWNVLTLDRWQAFVFGRPLSIAAHHFDTQLPSYCDPADKSGRLYLPYVAFFRLANILGEIVNDAVSFRQIPYDSILAHDRALSQWLESLPEEIVLDDHSVARGLTSHLPAVLRPVGQCIAAHTTFYHIRFTLHRPYASASGKMSRRAQSVETAVTAADKLIILVGQTCSQLLTNKISAFPGHSCWGPFHLFSAALFFCFQLIGDPSQPGADLFRANVQRSITILERSRDIALADKAFKILHALSPLYSPEFSTESAAEREKKKVRVLSLVRTLAFPYHDMPKYQRSSPDSSSTRGCLNSPTDSIASISLPISSVRNTISTEQQSSSLISPNRSNSHDQITLAPSFSPLSTYPPHKGFHQQQDDNQSQFVKAVDEDMMWGASVGCYSGEWTSFLEALQLPAPAAAGHNEICP